MLYVGNTLQDHFKINCFVTCGAINKATFHTKETNFTDMLYVGMNIQMLKVEGHIQSSP